MDTHQAGHTAYFAIHTTTGNYGLSLMWVPLTPDVVYLHTDVQGARLPRTVIEDLRNYCDTVLGLMDAESLLDMDIDGLTDAECADLIRGRYKRMNEENH